MKMASRLLRTVEIVNRNRLRKTLVNLLALAGICSVAATALGSTVAQVEAQPSGTTGLTIDNASGQYPLITAILSQPGTANGSNFSSWAFLANDGTGSIDIFGALPAGYTPAVGDAISVTGRNSPFNGFPEMQAVTAINKISSGNVVPSPLSETIPQINVNPLPLTIGGYLVTLNNVTISNVQNGDTTFGSANRTATITDGSSNSMTLFYNPGTYSLSNTNLFGNPIPTVPVAITGYMQIFTSGSTKTPELIPMSIVFPPPPGQVYWNPSGTIGGPGTWNTVDPSWNSKSDGSGTSAAFAPSNYATFTGTGGTVTIAPAGVTSNGLQLDSNGYIIQGGKLTLGDTVDAGVTVTNAIKVTNASDTATINAQVSGSSGLAKTGGGTLVLGSSANDFTGDVTISGGTLQIASDANLGDSMNGIVLKGGTLKFNAPSGDVSLGSTRALSGTGGTLDVGAGHKLTVNGTVNTSGTLILPANENLVLAGGSGTKNLGGLSVGANSNATVNGDVNVGTTAASFSIAAGASVVITGTLNTQLLAATAHIAVSGPGTFDLQNADTNFIHPLQIGSAGNTGPTVIARNTNSLGYGPFAPITMFFNSGTITNQSGGLLQFGSNLKDSIGGTGSFPSTFAGADMEFQGPVNIFRPGGTAQNRIAINNQTTFSGGWTTDAGTLTNISGVVFSGSGTLTLSTATGGDFSKLVVPIAVDTATVNFNGTDPNNIPSLSVTNNGTLNLGAENAFAGATVPAAVTLSSGGKLSTGGNNQAFGALTVNGLATLDLGKTKNSSPDNVQLADSHTVSWSSSPLLRITNWTGALTGSGADRVMIGAGGLTASQLSAVHFAGYLTGATILSTGELVPAIPTRLLAGDLNQDQHVNAADISTLLNALGDLNAYVGTHSGFDKADLLDVADINGDGAVTNADLQALLNNLKGGTGSVAPVPEPSSLLLVGPCAVLLLVCCRRRMKAAH